MTGGAGFGTAAGGGGGPPALGGIQEMDEEEDDDDGALTLCIMVCMIRTTSCAARSGADWQRLLLPLLPGADAIASQHICRPKLHGAPVP